MQSGPGAVVVIVEPDADNCEMYTEFLRYRGFLPVPVSSATDALTAAATADVVVTGTFIPGSMDGFELIARLRSARATKRVPIIMLTASGCQSDHERSVAALCDAFLTKPCVPDVLVSEIMRVVSEHRGVRTPLAPAQLAQPPHRVI
jgi:CheY-like chemotaxis protein